MHNLKPAKLKSLQAGWHNDGGGLALVVTEAGSRSWAMKYTIKGTGKRDSMGLGGLKDVSLIALRIEAEKIRTAAREGRNPKRVLNAEAEDNKGSRPSASSPTSTCLGSSLASRAKKLSKNGIAIWSATPSRSATSGSTRSPLPTWSRC